MGIFHGLEDSVVPFEQAKIIFNALTRFSSHPLVVETLRTEITGPNGQDFGLKIFFRGFELTPAGRSQPDWNQHLDSAFQYSKSVIPVDLYLDGKDSFQLVSGRTRSDIMSMVDRNSAELSDLARILDALDAKAKRNDCRVRDLFTEQSDLQSYVAAAHKGSDVIRALRSLVAAGERSRGAWSLKKRPPSSNAKDQRYISIDLPGGEIEKPEDALKFWIQNECKI